MRSAALDFPKGFEAFQAIRLELLVLDFEGFVIRQLQGYVKPQGFGRNAGCEDSLINFDHETEAHAGMDLNREIVVNPISILTDNGIATGFKGNAGLSFGDKETTGVDGDLAGIDDLNNKMRQATVRGVMAHEDFSVKAFV